MDFFAKLLETESAYFVHICLKNFEILDRLEQKISFLNLTGNIANRNKI